MEFYQETTVLTTITQMELAEISRMINFLLEQGDITKECADLTMRRLAEKYELSPIYVW